MFKTKKIRIISILMIMLVVGSILFLGIKTGLNISGSIRENNLYNIIFIFMLSGILALSILFIRATFRNKLVIIQILNLISVAMTVGAIYYNCRMDKNLRLDAICAIIAIITLVILIIPGKKKNPDRYIYLDTTTNHLTGHTKNTAEREFEKSRNNSAFYSHKKVDASAYFEGNKTSDRKSYQKGSFINVPDNNYENAFMENSNYAESRTNNTGMAYDFNQSPANARVHSNMKDNISRNTTDINSLNEEFIKKYHSKNGL